MTEFLYYDELLKYTWEISELVFSRRKNHIRASQFLFHILIKYVAIFFTSSPFIVFFCACIFLDYPFYLDLSEKKIGEKV